MGGVLEEKQKNKKNRSSNVVKKKMFHNFKHVWGYQLLNTGDDSQLKWD